LKYLFLIIFVIFVAGFTKHSYKVRTWNPSWSTNEKVMRCRLSLMLKSCSYSWQLLKPLSSWKEKNKVNKRLMEN